MVRDRRSHGLNPSEALPAVPLHHLVLHPQDSENTMTIDQFTNHGWTPGQSCDYGGVIYKIASVDFSENLVGLQNPLSDEGITWVRCENIILQNSKMEGGQP